MKNWTCIGLVSTGRKRITHSQASLRDGKTQGTSNKEDVQNLHLKYKKECIVILGLYYVIRNIIVYNQLHVKVWYIEKQLNNIQHFTNNIFP